MEKFEFEDERDLELFEGFTSKTKNIFRTLIDNIKKNIKDYEFKIEETTKDISENETSREKCELEITKMENKIDTIKEIIENVENTYKKIADAYSSTSKGETKELYSEIIDGAKSNCDKDVEKNRSEIARLNSDIEAIKNNILEFTKVIDELNKDLESYNLELFKYNKALEYIEKLSDRTNADLDEISSRKEISKKPDIRTVKRPESKKVTRTKEETFDTPKTKENKSSIKNFEAETFETPVIKETQKPKTDPYEDSIKQIFDLTGYNPNKKEESPSFSEESKTIEPEPKKVYTDNLENLFSSNVDEEPTSTGTSFLDTDFSNWETMLNTPTDNKPEQNKDEDTVNQLLVPYGTSFTKLKSLTSNEIIRKDGSRIPFDIKPEDIMKAVSDIDGNDLKAMKTVGPEITILRKIKQMKEGNR